MKLADPTPANPSSNPINVAWTRVDLNQKSAGTREEMKK